MLGASYERIADSSCSATTIRNRRDEWIAAGVFTQLEQLCLEAYDKSVGLDLSEVIVDGCIVKAPCGGEAAGRSPVDRGKQGTKRSLLVEATGIPLGCVIAGAHRNDSPLLLPTLEHLGRFDRAWASVCPTTSQCISTPATTRPRTRDLLDELGCDGVISRRASTPSGQAMGRRTHQLLAQPRVPQARDLHRTTRPRHQRLHRSRQRRHRDPTTLTEAWTTHRWDDLPARRP